MRCSDLNFKGLYLYIKSFDLALMVLLQFTFTRQAEIDQYTMDMSPKSAREQLHGIHQDEEHRKGGTSLPFCQR